MMSRHDAERIADSVAAIRVTWMRASLMTLLADYRHMEPMPVHLALLWLAYDTDTKSPGRLKEDGPWWKAGVPDDSPRHIPTWTDPNTNTTRARPDTIHAHRHRLGHHDAAPNPDCPNCQESS